jgi:cytoskeletal protein RodZ
MNFFTPKKLTPDSNWGEELRQARRFKNLKIETVAKKLKIRSEYLNALEEERLDQLPAGLYGRNFLKEYAVFLGLDAQESLKRLEERGETIKNNDPFSQKIVKKKEFIAFPKIIRSLLIGTGILICFLYLIIYSNKVFSAPRLEIYSPEKSLVTAKTSFLISGRTEKEAEVKINGETVLNNHEGSFTQTINLKKGLNNITIVAKKKYSREKTIIRQILVE